MLPSAGFALNQSQAYAGADLLQLLANPAHDQRS
jgi:hypothetical protein